MKVQELRQQGMSISEISRALHLDRKTVRKQLTGRPRIYQRCERATKGESVRGLFTRTLGAGCPQRQQAVWRNPEARLPGRLYPDQGTRAALARGGTATG